MMLFSSLASGQTGITKSGTATSPAFRVQANIQPLLAKSSAIPDPTAGTYIIVTRPDLEAPLQPFIQWKRMQGYRVELLISPTDQRDSIRNALLHRFNNSTPLQPPQRYVLIVGDVDRIPSFWGKHTPSGLRNFVTDLYYGEYTGDYVPEAWVGRLSVADSAELSWVVDKIVGYEQGRWASAERLLLTAGKEDRAPAPITTNGQVNYLAQLAAACRPEIDTICYRNPESDSLFEVLVGDLNQHNALVNYTAHCTAAGWSSPYVGIATLDTLAEMTPTVFVNNCCLSNAFNSNCFGESLLRHPTAGAAAVIGCTNESLWVEDYYWAVGAKYPVALNPSPDSTLPGGLDATLRGRSFDPDRLSLGAMNYAGCSAVTLAGSPYDAFYWELYNILGDPSTTLFWGNADTVELNADTVIDAGSSTMAVRTTPWARVSATTDSLLLATSLADSTGYALLAFAPHPHLSHFTLTATMPEHIAVSQRVGVAQPIEARLAPTDAWISNDTLAIVVENVGLRRATSHTVAWVQTSDDLLTGAHLPTQPAHPLSATLGNGEQDTLRWDISGYSIGPQPIADIHVLIADSNGINYHNWPIRLAMDDERPTLTAWQIQESDGTPATTVYHHHNYQLSATFTLPCDSIRLAVNDSSIATFEGCSSVAMPYTTPDQLSHLHIEFICHKGNWNHRFGTWITPYLCTEDFESGNKLNLPWQETSLYPWVIDSATAHNGNYSLRSAPISHAQKSTIALEIDVLADDSLSFHYQVSSDDHDWLYFYIDGRRCGYWSGDKPWARFVRPISPGRHLLEWVYQKDASVDDRDDCARIDDLQLPLCSWSQPYGRVIPIEEPTLGIGTFASQPSQLTAVPNPARHSTTLHHPASPHAGVVTLYNTYGQVVDKIKIAPNTHHTQYSTAYLRLGIYLLVLRQGDNTSKCKIIVTR